jgi:hypothetical protein
MSDQAPSKQELKDMEYTEKQWHYAIMQIIKHRDALNLIALPINGKVTARESRLMEKITFNERNSIRLLEAWRSFKNCDKPKVYCHACMIYMPAGVKTAHKLSEEHDFRTTEWYLAYEVREINAKETVKTGKLSFHTVDQMASMLSYQSKVI